jgi:anti-anti-sigma factor
VAGSTDRTSESSDGNEVELEEHLDIRLSVEGERAVLEVGGEVDLATVEQFRTALLDAQRSEQVVLDLSGVTFMDSAGINALVGAYHRKLPNGELRLVGMRSNVQKALEITGLLVLFQDDQRNQPPPASGGPSQSG